MPQPTLESLRESAVVHAPSARARIAITGEDRFTWLNGMTTCDLAKIGERGAPRAAYGCVLNVKGKVLGDVIVVARDGDLAAFVPARSAPTILELWNKYVIMEDVELAADDSRRLLSLQGGAAASIADRAGFTARAAPLDELGLSGVVIDIEVGELDVAIARLVDAGAQVLDDEAMHRLAIEAARPTFGADLDEHNYVQEAGLEVRAVSFQKGCYLGQEVVCMLQMRGKVHKRLMKLQIASEGALPVVGA